MYNLGMNPYGQYPSNMGGQYQSTYNQPSMGYQPSYTPIQANMGGQSNIDMAMGTAQDIQESPQGLMGAAWDNSMDKYQNTYDDLKDSYNNSQGLMGFINKLTGKGYRGAPQGEAFAVKTPEELGYRRY